ncbi:MAG TPA: glycoside hydrolase family 2 TIM barrel-domain containing protein [Chitinophagaceae bacterium]|nr:glycoside hydrolase family 2 TIM barrel-domain containing protein [Chitinophagaceae bacterium]
MNVISAAYMVVALLLVQQVFAQPAAPTGSIKKLISFTTQNSVKLEVTFNELPVDATRFSIRIAGDRSGKSIFEQEIKTSTIIREEKKMIFSVTGLSVDKWFPNTPNLYQLTFTQTTADNKTEEQKQRIGFRFFESRNGHFYLNDKPIFLRGIAINPPARGIPDSVEKSRKFAEEYVRYMKSIHVNIIRIPDNATWYEVCDELGMMVFGGNYSSTVMGEKPPKDYDKAVLWYKNEAYDMIAAHPSLMIYAMTNEVPYEDEIGVQWEKFLSYAHAKLKEWDNTRLYIANPGYGYGKSGDICDLHRYWGWYYCSPFNFINIRDNAAIVPFPKKQLQPVTFTECVGNYTGPDGKYNLTPDHKNPGSQLNWTGHAGWSDQARLADEHQSFTFKQATEMFRRLRVINPELSGVFPFTILFYNWNNVERFVDMGPKPVTKQARLSYQPILLSWENWQSQVYAGSVINPIVHIVNDDDGFSDLVNAKLVYELQDNSGRVLTSDTINLSDITYYSTWQKKLAMKLPSQLPMGDYQLAGKVIAAGKLVSENYDKLFIGNKEWLAAAPAAIQKIILYDPQGKTATSFDKLNISYSKISSFNSIPLSSLLVIGENSVDEIFTKQAALVKQFVKNGGRVVCLRQDAAHLPAVNSVLSAAMQNVTTPLDVPAYPPPARPSRNGYYVNPERPDHPVFNGVKREQLRVWSDYTGWDASQKGFPAIYPVTDGYVPVDKKDIGRIAVLGNYGVALEGITIAEVADGKGSVLLCGLDLAGRTKVDPVADRMLINMINYMADGKQHQLYPLITEPIVWGDYESEKGVLTGVNSGLMVHAVPRVPANIKTKITVTKEGNRFLGATGGFNTRPGIQYVAYGRRMYGPYYLRGFGNTPETIDTTTNVGEGYFWCSIPAGKTMSSTLVWNQADEPFVITIKVNEKTEVSKEIKAGETITVECPVSGTNIKMHFRSDRRLVLLQTSFR